MWMTSRCLSTKKRSPLCGRGGSEQGQVGCELSSPERKGQATQLQRGARASAVPEPTTYCPHGTCAQASPALAAPRAGSFHSPDHAVWEVTLACDLACRHCGSRAGKARPDELSTEECLDLVRQMAARCTRVSLIGGEAYLRDDWLEIVREIRRQA